jgi:hypothetical protein
LCFIQWGWVGPSKHNCRRVVLDDDDYMFRPCLAIFRSLHLTIFERKTYTQLVPGGPVCGAGSWRRILAWHGECGCCFGGVLCGCRWIFFVVVVI